jgi:carbonic anhydrase
MSEVVKSILEHNQQFVQNKEYEAFQTDKFPNKRIVVLTCMDTRLIELLPKAMGIQNGDAKLIRNAGAMITDPYDSITRSILVALYELKAEEVLIVGHYGCGMTGLQADQVLEKAYDRGVSSDAEAVMHAEGVSVHEWLRGFSDVEDNVHQSVQVMRNHPLLPPGTPVHGLVISPETGELTSLDTADM